LFSLAEGGQKLGGIESVDQWPWSWVRLLSYIKKVKNVFERVGLDPEPETAMPPKWMFFGHEDELDEWFEERREALKDAKKKKDKKGRSEDEEN
jgi:hypothetical protein